MLRGKKFWMKKNIFSGRNLIFKIRVRFFLTICCEEKNLAQLQIKLDDEIAVAARSERAGNKVAAPVQEAIDRLQGQIKASEKKLAGFDREIEEVNREYAPFIHRLEEIESAD